MLLLAPLGSAAGLDLKTIDPIGAGMDRERLSGVDPPKDMVRVIMLQRTNGGGDVADEINAFLAMAAAAISQ